MKIWIFREKYFWVKIRNKITYVLTRSLGVGSSFAFTDFKIVRSSSSVKSIMAGIITGFCVLTRCVPSSTESAIIFWKSSRLIWRCTNVDAHREIAFWRFSAFCIFPFPRAIERSNRELFGELLFRLAFFFAKRCEMLSGRRIKLGDSMKLLSVNTSVEDRTGVDVAFGRV